MIDEIVVPKSWIIAIFRDILTLNYGKGLRKDKRDDKGDFAVFGSSGVVGYHSNCLLNHPCLIIGRKGSIGKIFKSITPCWPIDTTYYLTPPKQIDLDFLFHLFNSLGFDRMDKSTAIPGLNRDDVYKRTIILPPLNEQRRIVAKIEKLFTKLDAGMDLLKDLKVQVKRYRQAVLKSAFTGELTREWREEQLKDPNSLLNKEPASSLVVKIRKKREELEKNQKIKVRKEKLLSPIDILKLSKLPECWKWVQIGEICKVVSGKTPKGINKINNNNGLPFFKVADMNRAENRIYMRKAGIYLNVRQIKELKPKVVKRKTVIFPKRGGAIATNKIRIINKDSAFDLNIMGVCPLIFPDKYFFYLISSVNLITLSDGSNVPQINHHDIEPLVIPFAPLSEQKVIIEEIDKHFSIADELEKFIDQSIKQGKKLRQSILKKAFEGKLVPQDPNDEPASVLLKKIKAEKAKREAEEKSRRKKSKRK
ncbi:MAG: restriction endonuclease subunit S [Candidatus Eremiobacteraeota bacterium]|nr:restriction endonuclease subunit S [Candidatus Eremiobacteraeota bacterium]